MMRIRMRYSRTTFARFSTNHRARHSFPFTDEAQQRRLSANCRLNLEFPSADAIPVNPRMNGPGHAAAFWRAHVDAWLQPRLLLWALTFRRRMCSFATRHSLASESWHATSYFRSWAGPGAEIVPASGWYCFVRR